MKTMTRNNLKELTDALEEIRNLEYPDIPRSVIEQIIAVQYDNQDDRVQARNQTMKIVADYFHSVIKEKGGE